MIIKPLLTAAALFFYGRRDNGDWIYEKIHHFSTLWATIVNLGFYLLKVNRIYKLTSVVVEPVFGCNLKCTYCGHQLADLGQRPFLLDNTIFATFLNQLPSSVESVTFGALGEPFLHPDLLQMIQKASEKGFRTIVFTNGTLLQKRIRAQLAATPLDVLNVSVEPDQETSLAHRGTDLNQIYRNLAAFHRIKPARTDLKLALVEHPGNQDKIKRIKTLWPDMIKNIKISPMMDFTPRATCRDSSCFEPWRGNLTLLSNGDLTPCCLDASGELAIGNIQRESLASILKGGAYRTLLKNLARPHRSNSRCRGCTEFQSTNAYKRLPVFGRPKK